MQISKTANDYRDMKHLVEAMQKAPKGWVPLNEDIHMLQDTDNVLVYGEQQHPALTVVYGSDTLRMYDDNLVVLNDKELCYLIDGRG